MLKVAQVPSTARPAGWVNCFSICALCKYNAESPKQGSKRFNYIAKTKYIADLGIIYLWQNGL